MSGDEVAARVVRFDELAEMTTPIDRNIVSQEAMDVILARTILPVIMEKTHNPFGDTGGIYGCNGLTMNISVLPPVQGPCLHAHNATFETFFVLEGYITFFIGEDGGQSLTLGPWDTFSCPPGVYRGYTNASDAARAVLLTIINGDPDVRADVNVPPAITRHLRDTYGAAVVNEFRKIADLPED